jgi:ribosomal protein S6--L-glutamate ligase
MRLVLLSRSRTIPSTRRLAEAATARGHVVRVLNPANIALKLDGEHSKLLTRSRTIRTPDLVIPRIAASIANIGLPVVDQFALQGAAVMNTALAIGRSRNPARCLQHLASNGLSVPTTVMARDAGELKALVDDVGGVPVLVKLHSGSERRAVMVCESLQSLEAALEAVLGLGHQIVMQQYVKRGHDLRVFVVGGQALAAVSRLPRPGRVSRTLNRFARLEAVPVAGALKTVAERAAQLCELEVCAVDMIEAKGQLKVFEVNASPALPEMETATGVDLAQAIIVRAEFLVNERAARPSAPK